MTVAPDPSDVVTALRVQVDALAAELERLRAESAADAQIIEGWKRAIGSQYAEIEQLRARLVSAERALEAARAMVAMHPKTHKERHWWQYAPCRHSLFVELRQALEGLDESKKQETAS